MLGHDTYFIILRPHHADTQIIGVVADPLQGTQDFGKDDIRFWVANTRFQPFNMPLTGLPVQSIEFTFHLTNVFCQRFIVLLKSFDRR